MQQSKQQEPGQHAGGHSHTAPLQSVEPSAAHWLLRHDEVARLQHTPPHSTDPCLQQTLLPRQLSSGPHTRPPQAADPLAKQPPAMHSCVVLSQHAAPPQQRCVGVQQSPPHCAAALQQRLACQQSSSSLQQAARSPEPHCVGVRCMCVCACGGVVCACNCVCLGGVQWWVGDFRYVQARVHSHLHVGAWQACKQVPYACIHASCAPSAKRGSPDASPHRTRAKRRCACPVCVCLCGVVCAGVAACTV